MNNFTYCNPTRLVFGRGVENEIGGHLARLPEAPKKVLIVYGGGSAVKSGVLDRVSASCVEAGIECVVKGGVQPNPTIEFVRECIDTARAEAIEAVVAVGGGSVIDTAKTVAVGFAYEGDPWDFFTGAAAIESALPVATVLTIPAAGSEQSIRAVITNGDVKTGIGNDFVRPRVSCVNPELFFTLPQKQVSAGVIDMMSHIMERYFTNTSAVDYTSAQAEAALRVIMENGLKLLENHQDYDAWCQVGLAGSFAHNGYFGMGHQEDWACHAIEHALSGWRTDIIHGEGLAVVTPAWMRYVWSSNPERFVRFAKNVFDVPDQENDEATINMMIAKFSLFLQRMLLPTRLSELTDVEVPIDEVAALATARGPVGNLRKLSTEAVRSILTSAL